MLVNTMIINVVRYESSVPEQHSMPSPLTTVQHIAGTWQLIVLLRLWAQVTSWSNWVHPQKWPYIFFAIVMIVAESLTCCACSVCVCALYLEEVKKTLQTRYNSPLSLSLTNYDSYHGMRKGIKLWGAHGKPWEVSLSKLILQRKHNCCI